MASILAIVSKAMFDREARRSLLIAARGLATAAQPRARKRDDRPRSAAAVALGQTLDGIDRYISRGPGLAPLQEGGSLVLVTVRPPKEDVWLVAILEDPKLGEDGYVASHAITIPLTDVTTLVHRLLKEQHLKPVRGRLAMSLQSPRQISAEWVDRFRAAAGVDSPSSSLLRKSGSDADIASGSPFSSLRSPGSPTEKQSQQSQELPLVLREPPWRVKQRRPPHGSGRSLDDVRIDLGSKPTRVDWPGHSHELALGVARLRKCANWRDATRAQIEAVTARSEPLTGPLRICLGVLATLPEDDAHIIARRVPLRSYCHQSSLLLPALARLGPVMIPTIVKAAMSKERRAAAFSALEHIGTPLAVPAILDAMTRVPTLRPAARRWLRRYADVALVALVPLALGIPPSALGLDGLHPQTAKPLQRAAALALRFVNASSGETSERIARVARDLGLEEETEACLSSHPLIGRKAPTVPPYRDVPRPFFATTSDSSRGSRRVPITTRDFDVMLELLALVDWDVKSVDVDALERAFDEPSIVLMLEGLLAKWVGARARRRERWILDAACQMAGGVLQARVIDLIRAWRSVYQVSSDKAIDTLARAAIARAGEPAGERALQSLGELSHRSGTVDRQVATKLALEHVADALDLPNDTLDDRLVPHLGLDEKGRMTLEIADRTLIAHLDSALTPYLTTADTNQRVAELPRAERRGMRAMKSKGEREAERWASLRKEAKVVAEDVARRAEAWMRRRKRWTKDELLTHIAGHPVLRQVAQGLVWGAYDDRHQRLVTTFRVCEDGTLADRNDERLEALPPNTALTGVVHPAEIDDMTIAAWADLLFDYRIVPLFPQLAWPVVRLMEEERDMTELSRFTNVVLMGPQLSRLWSLGWREGPPMGNAPLPRGTPIPMIGYEKQLTCADGSPARVVMMLAESPPFARMIVGLRVQRFTELGYDNWLRWSEIDPVSVSELLLELAKLKQS